MAHFYPTTTPPHSTTSTTTHLSTSTHTLHHSTSPLYTSHCVNCPTEKHQGQIISEPKCSNPYQSLFYRSFPPYLLYAGNGHMLQHYGVKLKSSQSIRKTIQMIHPTTDPSA